MFRACTAAFVAFGLASTLLTAQEPQPARPVPTFGKTTERLPRATGTEPANSSSGGPDPKSFHAAATVGCLP
jgi:hypothetical protein